MQIEHHPEDYRTVTCDLLAYPVFEEEKEDFAPLDSLDNATNGAVRAVLSSGEFKPERFRTCKIFRPAGLNSSYLLLIGAGKKAEFEPARLRELAGAAVRNARSYACTRVAFLCRGDHPAALAVRLAVEGAFYGNYEGNLYRTRERDQKSVESFRVLCEGKGTQQEIQEAIRRATIVGEATNFARTLSNEPSNILTPAQFAERAVTKGSQAGLDVQVLDEEQMKKLGMNALLAVSRGSEEPPRLIIMKTRTANEKAQELTALVGKGVTFDSGGISIKPSEKMEEMKGDMSGGAAVLGAMIALSQFPSPRPVIGLIPAVENLPSGKATKPGDVVKSYSGKTIEIINTDAEGRLILADAMAYARTLGATRIIDIATLTGACVVALGQANAGMMGTDQETIDRLRGNCRLTGEGLWQLPIDDEYGKAIKSEIADMKNVGDRRAGAITAAKFLQEFVETTPWVHLDIAGTDLDNEGRPFACKGATGFGVRTLAQLLEE